jgi:hypothetical protein
MSHRNPGIGRGQRYDLACIRVRGLPLVTLRYARKFARAVLVFGEPCGPRTRLRLTFTHDGYGRVVRARREGGAGRLVQTSHRGFGQWCDLVYQAALALGLSEPDAQAAASAVAEAPTPNTEV